jgi:hypothetical protein
LFVKDRFPLNPGSVKDRFHCTNDVYPLCGTGLCRWFSEDHTASNIRAEVWSIVKLLVCTGIADGSVHGIWPVRAMG